MKINFHLVRQDQSSRSSESWLVHTDGCCWIDAGKEHLFEVIRAEESYSDSGKLGAKRVDGIRTYVGELLLRLAEVSPHALEPVPQPLEKYLSSDGLPRFFNAWTKWLKEADSKYDLQDPIWIEHDIATGWLASRVLDSSYLPDRPKVWLWSNSQQEVHWCWDFDQSSMNSGVAYTATRGIARETSDIFTQTLSEFAVSLFDEIEQSATISMKIAREEVLDSIYQDLTKQPNTNWLRVQLALKRLAIM